MSTWSKQKEERELFAIWHNNVRYGIFYFRFVLINGFIFVINNLTVGIE